MTAPTSLRPFGHGRLVCRICKTVVAQCRCIEGHRIVHDVVCDRCHFQPAPASPEGCLHPLDARGYMGACNKCGGNVLDDTPPAPGVRPDCRCGHPGNDHAVYESFGGRACSWDECRCKDYAPAPKQVEPLRPDVQAEKFYAPPPEKPAREGEWDAYSIIRRWRLDYPSAGGGPDDAYDRLAKIFHRRASQPEGETVTLHRAQPDWPWEQCDRDLCVDPAKGENWEHATATIRRKL